MYIFLFKSVAQLVLIFGAETWVVTSHMERILGEVPVPGVATTYREDPAAADRQEMVIRLGGGVKGGGGIRGNRRVHLEKAEHGRAVHSYTIAYGDV